MNNFEENSVLLARSFLIVMDGLKQDVHFANVEFELESHGGLQRLIDYFGDNVNIHYHDRLENGGDFVSLSLRNVESGIYGQPDETISIFCTLVEDMPPSVRKMLNECKETRFDIGFESGNTKKRYNTKIKPETVGRVAEIGASIVITIYPVWEHRSVIQRN